MKWCWWFRHQRIRRRWSYDRNADHADGGLISLFLQLFVCIICLFFVVQHDYNLIRVVECSSNDIGPKLNNVAIVPRIKGGSSSRSTFASSLLRRGRSLTSTSLSDAFPSELDEEDDDDIMRSIVEMETSVDTKEQPQKVDLAFEQIEMILSSKKRGDIAILDGTIRGRAKPGRMLAIMGPSGAGKSSLLHALAGRVKDSSAIRLYGSRFVNGIPLSGHYDTTQNNSSNKKKNGSNNLLHAALIEQEVSFFPYMTVRETLNFRVELKLGSHITKKERDRIVDEILQQMALSKSGDTIVGNSKVRGISGGERKRLSIAIELISSPSILFLDEPTSGLDSTAATSLIDTLRTLADRYHKTIIAVIHQPSQHVFTKFDDLLLLADGGKQMYFGERQAVRSYMETYVGCSAPEDIGTAEFILDCITASPMNNDRNYYEKSTDEAMERIQKLSNIAKMAKIDLGLPKKHKRNIVANSYYNGKQRMKNTWTEMNQQLKNMASTKVSSSSSPRANIFVQFRLLLVRSLHEVFRGKGTILLKLIQQITTAFIYGGIYTIGNNQASIIDRFGLLSLLIIGSTNLSLAQTIRSFPKEKAIISSELTTKLYSTLPYFIGKAISEIPISAILNCIFGSLVYKLTGLDTKDKRKFPKFLSLLTLQGIVAEAAGLFIGSISPNSDFALALFPAVIVLSIIFDGKNISEENTPKPLRWISKIGLIRWGYEGLCINEFSGLEFDTTPSSGKSGGGFGGAGPPRRFATKTGADALDRFGLGSRSIADIVRAQVIVASSCWLLSFVGLTLTKQKFEIMLPPHKKQYVFG